MKKILICEDEEALAYALELTLKGENFSTRIALNGHDAIKFVQDEKFDIILLDILMPGPDGFQVLKKLRENNITTPVIVTSNLSEQVDVDRALQLGAKEYLIKTEVSLDEIVEKVKSYVHPEGSPIVIN